MTGVNRRTFLAGAGSGAAALALARLARREGTSQRAVLERLIAAADDAVTGTLQPDAPEWAAYYFDVTQ